MNRRTRFLPCAGIRKCITCEVPKPYTSEFFQPDRNGLEGLTARCRVCRYKTKRAWEVRNPEKKRAAERDYYARTRDTGYLERKRVWRYNNRDKDRAWARRWTKANLERVRERSRRYYLDNPDKRLGLNIRRQMRRNLINGREVYRDLPSKVGYTTAQLKRHLEKTFQPGMSWDNYGYRGWHIDHIEPVASFKLMNDDGRINLEAVRKCWALKNLRAMWGTENREKSATIGSLRLPAPCDKRMRRRVQL